MKEPNKLISILCYDNWAVAPRRVYIVCTQRGRIQFENDFVSDGAEVPKPILIPENLQTEAVKQRVAKLSIWPINREYNIIGTE